MVSSGVIYAVGIIIAMIQTIATALRNSSATRLLRNPPNTAEIRRLLRYQRPYQKRMLLALVALGFSAGLGLAFPWMLQNLITAVFVNQATNDLNRITAILLLIFLLRAAFGYLENYQLTFIGESITRDLRLELYTHLNHLGLRFYADRRVGELISRLASDVLLVRTALTSSITVFLYQLLNFTGSLALMLWLNARLTLFILALAPAFVLFGRVFGRRLQHLSTGVQDRLAESTALAEQGLGSVRVVKAFGREAYEVERYGHKIAQTFQLTMQLARLRAAFGPLLSFLSFSALAMILWFGGNEVLRGQLSVGQLIAFLAYGLNIASSMSAFTNVYASLQEALGASRRVFDLLDENPEVTDQPGAIAPSQVNGQITLEGVSFAYEYERGVLHDIHLDIQPGEVLALVGPSGAGKTTFFNLIPRFYDPTTGRILLDGQDIRGLQVTWLREQIGLVPQDTQLFSDSVRENLRYGKLDASDAELEAAARAANAEEFIQRLPQGYDTLVGERGVKLSGGQRQRIAIARALLKNPRILLLDEATSSLDSESEGLVQSALELLMKNRTTLIIAHRLSTVQRADRIAVLQEGRLVELGKHADLLHANGLYARLYHLQFDPQRLAV
jgi:subfamily B ATP-binding cassette protein MsbA